MKGETDANRYRSNSETVRLTIEEEIRVKYGATDREYPGFEGLVGNSRSMCKVYEMIEKVSKVDIDVLITGESGTGKDIVAKTIHKLSDRRDGPFIPINTGAMAKDLIASELFGYEKGAFTGAATKRKGKFEQAREGTLFLDEISTMSESTQVSLLRVLESKQFQRVGGETFVPTDARIIAATNVNLRKEVKEGRFRRDLFHRFNVLNVSLPPLRKRADDIVVLSEFFLKQYAKEFSIDVRGFSPEVLDVFRSYSWPGNVRELENMVLKLVVSSNRPTIEVDLLPDILRRRSRLKKSRVMFEVGNTTIEEAEKEIILKTLDKVKGNKKRAADILGISRKTLYSKLEEYKN